MKMTIAQLERYSRHIALPEFGVNGQEKLLTGKVLLVGIGGLGSSTGLHLAAAGVGTIGIMDDDTVDLSNLQRQIAHATPDVGRPKVLSAAEKYKAINPDIFIREYREQLIPENAVDIISEYDFIISGTDNFTAKFLLADCCHVARKPYTHAGVFGWEGQIMTVIPGQTTCYRCVFEVPPPAETILSCAQTGVFGALAGVMGTLQAAEAIKFLIGREELLTDKILTFHALKTEFRKIKTTRNPACKLCGNKGGISP